MRLFPFLAGFVLVLSMSAVAQDTKLAALPDVQTMDIQTYAGQSDRVKKTFENDPFLVFEVQLPKDMVERNYDVLKHYDRGDRVYGEVYRKDGVVVQDVRPYFSVKTHELNRAISAKNWFITNLLNKGHTLRAIEASPKGDSYEALYVRIDDLENTEIVRTRGFLKGPRVIEAEYVIPVLLWGQEQDRQTYAIKSFELKGPSDNALPEPNMSYTHLETFSMLYPQSWRMVSEIKDLENRIDLAFRSADDLKTIFADIEVTLVSDQSLKDPVDRSRYPVDLPAVIQARKQAVIESSLLIGDMLERRNYDLAVDHDLQITEIYPLRKKETDYVTHRQATVTKEFWITAIKGTKASGKNYIVSMVAPSRSGSNMYNWALAAKAYEIMVESLR